MRKKYPIRVKILAAIIMAAILLLPVIGLAGAGYWIYSAGIQEGYQQASQQRINLKGCDEKVVVDAAEYIRWRQHQDWLRNHPEAIGSIHD